MPTQTDWPPLSSPSSQPCNPIYHPESSLPSQDISVDLWDTAGQERFASMHPSYYYRANACILVFDVTRKSTYQHLEDWYKEMRRYCENIPCICVANKIDVNYEVTKKKFKFAEKNQLPVKEAFLFLFLLLLPIDISLYIYCSITTILIKSLSLPSFFSSFMSPLLMVQMWWKYSRSVNPLLLSTLTKP